MILNDYRDKRASLCEAIRAWSLMGAETTHITTSNKTKDTRLAYIIYTSATSRSIISPNDRAFAIRFEGKKSGCRYQA